MEPAPVAVVTGAARGTLPAPFNRTYPLTPAAQRIAAGVARRAAQVYAPPWVRVMGPMRGLLGPLSGPAGFRLAGQRRDVVRRIEEALVSDHRDALSRVVGAGGEADRQTRRRAGAADHEAGPGPGA